MSAPLNCATPDCAAPREPGRTLCRCCRARRQRLARPLIEAYRQLKANAKRRGKVFTLTLAWFQEVAIQTEYETRRGRTATSFHIDRIDVEQGYTDDNIQVLPAYINVRKNCPNAAPILRTFRAAQWDWEFGGMYYWNSCDFGKFMHELNTLLEPDYVPPPQYAEVCPF